MPYSRDPEAFAQVFYDILDLALKSDKRIVVTGDAKKLLRRFYAFKDAWKHRAQEAAEMGNFALSAEHSRNVAALLRYSGIIEKGKLVLLHKDYLSELAGERVQGSGETMDDPLLEAATLFAKARHGVLQEESRENPVIPGSLPNDNVALRIFGVDTSKAFERKVTDTNHDDTPLTEEEKETLRKSGMDI